jgi:hypothetical protein
MQRGYLSSRTQLSRAGNKTALSQLWSNTANADELKLSIAALKRRDK